jgi:hypothetical protein
MSTELDCKLGQANCWGHISPSPLRPPGDWGGGRYGIRVSRLFSPAAIAGGREAADKWTEYNLGPFYVDADSDASAARYDLTQLEQTRWVLSGLLEIKDLNATWPIRILVTHSAKQSRHLTLHDGYYLYVAPPGAPMPLGEVARLFLEANTPRLPEEVEHGVAELFDTLKASGSRVSWGGAPAHPDLAFARMQLFATKFEYGASFHIFLSSLRSGSTLHAAEHNAFGQDFEALEKEAAARLAANNWQAVSTSGRPLDPKRDFGDHSLEGSVARVFAVSAGIDVDPDQAETALKNSLNEGGAATALALDSLADVAQARKEKPDQYWDDAMQAGSKDAAVYVGAAREQAPDRALPLLKKAQLLNPLWAEPVFLQAEATDDLKQREELLKQALKMNPRSTDYWVTLARTQMADGHAQAAQSSWVRAEDSAPDEVRRKQVQDMHDGMENARLDQAEADRKREHDDAVLADQRAQQAEADRIHAAEEKANKANATASSSAGDIVDYGSLLQTEKASGSVILEDCHKDYIRVSVRDSRGKVRQLLYLGDDPGHKLFSCDNQPEKRQIVVTFHPKDDRIHKTDGEIVSVSWR